jgi:hypothetical protein
LDAQLKPPREGDSPKRNSYRVYTQQDYVESDSENESHSSKKSLNLSPKLQPVKGPSLYANRVILTTYPGQVGIKPIVMNWGHPDPKFRGPIVCSRNASSIKKRNATGGIFRLLI